MSKMIIIIIIIIIAIIITIIIIVTKIWDENTVKIGNLWSSVYFTETFRKFSVGKIHKKMKHFTENDAVNILF